MPTTAVKSITVSTSAATALSTATSWVPLDIFETPFNVGFGIDRTTGGDSTIRVEHTFDDVLDPDVTPVVYVHEDVSSVPSSGSSRDGNYAFGIRATRLAVVSASGSASINFRVVQVGSGS